MLICCSYLSPSRETSRPSPDDITVITAEEELQKLGKPPNFCGQEDEWSKWSFVMKSYVSMHSTHALALLAGAEYTERPDLDMARIRTMLTEDGVTATRKLFRLLVMNGRQALRTRYAPNTAPRVQSLMSTILNAKSSPSTRVH